MRSFRCKNFSGVAGIGAITQAMGKIYYKMIIKEIRKVMPEVTTFSFDPDTLSSDLNLTFVMLQHRYNKTISWMTSDIWSNTIEMITDSPGVHHLFSHKELNDDVSTVKHRAKWLKKFNRTFRKYTDLNGLVNALFQNRKMKRSVDMFVATHASNCIELHTLLTKNTYPQNLYNFLFHIIAVSKRTGAHRSGAIAGIIYVLRDRVNFGDNNYVLDMWIKLSSKLFETHDEVASWSTFRDTVRLAKTYGVRIRYNKINSLNDLNELHNILIGHSNRDRKTILCNYVIEEFEHPKVEYDGFTFEFISSTTRLTEAGRLMKNCSAGYALSCAKGTSIIFVMKKDDRPYTMIELNGQRKDVPIVQQKTICNIALNEKTLKTIEKWHNDVVIMHKDDAGCYYNPSYNAASFDGDDDDYTDIGPDYDYCPR